MMTERCDACGKRPSEGEVEVWPYAASLYASGKVMAEMVRSIRPETNEPLVDRRYHIRWRGNPLRKSICGILRQSTEQEDFTYWLMGERHE